MVTKDNTTVFNYDEVASFINDDGRFLYQLEPGTYSLTFEQGCKLDERHTAFIRHRSSILRCGGVITSGVYDPGFEVDEMGGMLIATEAIVLEKGARVAQIIMMENEAAELYDGQWQKDEEGFLEAYHDGEYDFDWDLVSDKCLESEETPELIED